MSITQHWPALTTVALTSALLMTSCSGGDDDDAETSPEPDQHTSAPPAEGTEEVPEDPDGDEAAGPLAQAELQDVAGNDVGTVEFVEEEDAGVRVAIEVQDLPPGFRGVSINQNGICEVQSVNEWGQVGDFFSAGGHLQGTPEPEPDVIEGEEELEEDQQAESEVDHPDRAGNLPNILINQDGSGHLEFVTDRLSEDLLLEDDGRSVIVHSEPDHHGNIPARYAPYGPDAESQATGDTGSRVACGVVG